MKNVNKTTASSEGVSAFQSRSNYKSGNGLSWGMLLFLDLFHGDGCL